MNENNKEQNSKNDQDQPEEIPQYFAEINKKTWKGDKFMVEKYTPYKILNEIEKIQLLEIERDISNQSVTITQFVRVFLKHMRYNQTEKEYLTIGLIDLFKDVLEYEKKFMPLHQHQKTVRQTAQGGDEKQPLLKWDTLTGYLIDNVIQGGLKKNILPNKYISKTTVDKYSQVYGSQKLDQFSPEVIGGSSLCLRRFKQSQKYIDSYHHNQGIRNVEYIKELKQILVLDNLTDEIHFYNENSIKFKSIKPKPENHIIDTGILYFSYSVQEKRIGACLQDYSLAFWDQNDGFTFEKTFSAHLEVLQIYIKYVEFCTSWITVDQKNVLYKWDIEKETADPLPKRHEERITDLCEITHLRLLAACSLDKKIIFWDLIQKVPAQIMKLDGGISCHSMQYCQDFRVMVTAQYENTISIWSFEGKDCSLLNRLKGHNSQITSIQILKGTPLIISSDEIGFIKTWDIRTIQCIQTVHFECKSSIHQFVNIDDSRFIGIEYRLHWFEFEDKAIVNANGVEFLNMSPISVRFNSVFNQLCIATKSDIRIVDIVTGQTKQIIANIVKDEDGQQQSDITQFQLTSDGKRFIIGDNKGKIKTFLYQNAALETTNQGHLQEITEIRIDNENGFLVSSGWDSSLVVQKLIGQKIVETGENTNNDRSERIQTKSDYDSDEEIFKSQILRTVKNAHFGQEISAVQLSTRLSMIATASHGIIFLWDYETLKLIGSMTNEQNEIQILEFIDPFPILCSLDVSGAIILWQPLRQFSLTFTIYKPLFSIKLAYRYKDDVILATKMTKLCRDTNDFSNIYSTENDRKNEMFEQFRETLNICKAFKNPKAINLIVSDDIGSVYVIDIQRLLRDHKIDSKSIDSMKRKEYNAYRIINNASNGIFQNPQDLLEEFDRKQFASPQNNTLTRVSSSIMLSLNQINAYVQNTFNMLDDTLHYKFKVSNEQVFVLTIIKVPPKFLVTSTNSQIIRIWSLFGEQLCALDIDQPLPYRWRIKISTFFQRQKKYLEAKKVLQLINDNVDFNKTQQKIEESKHSHLFKKAFEYQEKDDHEQMQKKPDLTNISQQNMRLSQYRNFSDGTQTLTFNRFLSNIEKEEKLLKNPKNYSLKIMEARKSKNHDEFNLESSLKNQNKFQNTNLDMMNFQSDGANRKAQGGNMTQISLIDKIESMINAQPKLHPKAKEWEKALDEDFRTIKRAKKYLEDTNQDSKSNGSNNNHIKKFSIKREPKQSTQNIATQKKLFTVQSSGNLMNDIKKIERIETNQSRFEPPEEEPKIIDKSISSYQSTHVITLFTDRNRKSNPYMNIVDKTAIQPASTLSLINKSKMDWLSYAQIKPDPLPRMAKDNIFTDDQQSTFVSKHGPSSNQYLDAQRIRNRLFKELDLKRKYHKKNFASGKQFDYLEQLKLNDDEYEPPQFLKELNSQRNYSKDKSSPRGIMESYIEKFKQDGAQTQRDSNKKSFSLLPLIKRTKL